MQLKYKPDFERAQQYWRAFWKHEIIDRPVVCVTAPIYGVTSKPPMPYMSGFDGDYLKALRLFEEWASTHYFGGETVPFCDLSFGPDQFTAFLGAELRLASNEATSWIKPFVENWGDIEPTLDTTVDSRWTMLLAFMRVGAGYSEGKFLLGMLDLHSNMDCLSAMRGPQNLCMDLINQGDEVEKVLNKVRLLYEPVYTSIYLNGNMENRGTVGWSPIYCREKSAVIQCDFLALIGPKHARRFVLPAIEEEASFLDHCVYHYDGPAALRHLDDILSIKNIDVIQWVPGDGQPRTPEWLELLKKIQKAGKGLWLYDWTIPDIKQKYKELSPEGLCFQVDVSSEREADDLLVWFKKNT
jgi:hypothetical protein